MSSTDSVIFLSPPHLGGEEAVFLREALESNWLSPAGPLVKKFESELSELHGGSNVVATNSGTAAIHLALLALKVKPGDEVFCSSLTFAASANPILYVGAKPVFIDSEIESWNMDPELLRVAIRDRVEHKKKPAAVILVHVYGVCARVKEIESICNEYEIPLIEDAAEALGSTTDGKPLGTFGRFGILSFNGNKIITTSGGGALICKDASDAEFASYLSTQARDRSLHYQHTATGYNYRMTNVAAAIGLGQLKVLPERIKQRRKNFRYYFERFSHLPGVSFAEQRPGTLSNRWLTVMGLPAHYERDLLVTKLAKEKIESRPAWMPLHEQPVFSSARYYTTENNSSRIFSAGICLPSGTSLKESEAGQVGDIIEDFLQESHSF